MPPCRSPHAEGRWSCDQRSPIEERHPCPLRRRNPTLTRGGDGIRPLAAAQLRAAFFTNSVCSPTRCADRRSVVSNYDLIRSINLARRGRRHFQNEMVYSRSSPSGPLNDFVVHVCSPRLREHSGLRTAIPKNHSQVPRAKPAGTIRFTETEYAVQAYISCPSTSTSKRQSSLIHEHRGRAGVIPPLGRSTGHEKHSCFLGRCGFCGMRGSGRNPRNDL